jgi:UDP-N-acetylmuramoyl-tripeptide--D-alanyl-D-alanine ligase
MERVTLEQVLAATGGAAAGIERPDAGVERVGLDSRCIAPGELFWAVRGETHDGHNFAASALARGAVACAVAADRAANIAGPRIVVRDTQEALGQFARWYRRTKRSLVIGVTGSVGKTTTREMIHAVLSMKYDGVRSPKNFNNQFGLPLSILDIEPQHEFAVLEIGASKAGEIRELAEIAAPEVGVITAVGEAHLETFQTLEQIELEKGQLIEVLPPTGMALLAGDDPRVRAIAKRARCNALLVGEGPENSVRASHIVEEPNRIRFQVDGRSYVLRAVGRHHVRAALFAIAAGREFGMGPEEIAEGLQTFKPAPGRCRLEPIGPWWVIDDTYNASPGSMRAACEVLRRWPGPGKRILIAGDMLELGRTSAKLHREIGRAAAQAEIDLLLGSGRHARDLVAGARAAGMPTAQAIHYEELEDLLAGLEERLEPGDAVLVKGSRGMRMERVIEQLRRAAVRQGAVIEDRNPRSSILDPRHQPVGSV